MHDKLFLFLGRGSELQEKGIRIQSSTLNPDARGEVFCLLQPALMTILIREEEEKHSSVATQWYETNIFVVVWTDPSL